MLYFSMHYVLVLVLPGLRDNCCRVLYQQEEDAESLYIPRVLMSWVRRTDDECDASSFVLQQPELLSPRK